MSAQRKRLYTRIISSIVIVIAITLMVIPKAEVEGMVYGYGPGGGGGGGGSGAPVNPNWEVCVNGNCDMGDVNFWGTALDSFWAISDNVQISIDKYTKIEGPDGRRFNRLTANKMADPPEAPDGYEVLAAFKFDPSGATFDPAITINVRFDPAAVDSGKTPVLAYYNEATGKWEFIEGTITGDGQAVFHMEHCSIYGVLSPVAPPQPTPVPSPAVAPSEKGGLSTGAIAGIIIGVLVVIALVLYFVLARKRAAIKPS